MAVANPPKPGAEPSTEFRRLLEVSQPSPRSAGGWSGTACSATGIDIFWDDCDPVFTFIALFANFLAPHNPLKINSGKRISYPLPGWKI
jgi:hypothetical protein